jgi:hypothetical protein
MHFKKLSQNVKFQLIDSTRGIIKKEKPKKLQPPNAASKVNTVELSN